jgi:hypothetical protein
MINHKSDPAGVEFGIGHGFTTASDAMALKLIRSRFLYHYGFQASARRPFNRIQMMLCADLTRKDQRETLHLAHRNRYVRLIRS